MTLHVPIHHGVHEVAPGFHVAAQLHPADLATLRQAGFATVINNRPDGEGGPDQPSSATLRAAAEAAGLAYHDLPVPPSGASDEAARAMRRLVDEAQAPVLAFCRSGRRSAALYLRGRDLG